ncbi:MatE family protein [Tritrichomonas foetus]|uniref:MatE family protein n=1 Tax=Tritrichomonas foetus TaxID=1144522 RepID=A0A1J4KW26_9EUKA|nr:MatE family protein [Tritrichomonas foetus]|eukprot:OHT15435.1 MatE family protein [Tritrichomonas foetus]
MLIISLKHLQFLKYLKYRLNFRKDIFSIASFTKEKRYYSVIVQKQKTWKSLRNLLYFKNDYLKLSIEKSQKSSPKFMLPGSPDDQNFAPSPLYQQISKFNSEIDLTDDLTVDTHSELFVGDGELKSLLILSSGPFISQVALSLYGVVDTMWIARTIGDQGIAAVGAVVVVEYVASALATYLSTCVSIQVSYLFGKGNKSSCSQMYVDFVRVAMFLGILVPKLILPFAKKLIQWLGADEDLVDMAFYYLIPSQCGCFFLLLFYMNCGLLEALGHSGVYAITQIVAFCLNMLCFDPLFLVAFKTPIWGASLSTIISNAIPGIFITVIVFSGKLEVKPNWRMFFRKFDGETFDGLKSAIADLIEAVSLDLPLVLMQKYLDSAAAAAGALTACLGVWSIISRLEQLISCVSNGIGEGLLPLASYAYGAGDFKRLFWLMIHSLWVMGAWAGTISLILIIFPKEICKIWSSDPDFLEWGEKMIRIYAYSGVLTAVDYAIPIILMAMKHPGLASLVSIFALLLPQPIFSTILYYTKKDDPARIIWTFDISDLFSLVIGGLFMIKPMHTMYKKIKKKNEENERLQDALIDKRKSQKYITLKSLPKI